MGQGERLREIDSNGRSDIKTSVDSEISLDIQIFGGKYSEAKSLKNCLWKERLRNMRLKEKRLRDIDSGNTLRDTETCRGDSERLGEEMTQI